MKCTHLNIWILGTTDLFVSVVLHLVIPNPLISVPRSRLARASHDNRHTRAVCNHANNVPSGSAGVWIQRRLFKDVHTAEIEHWGMWVITVDTVRCPIRPSSSCGLHDKQVYFGACKLVCMAGKTKVTICVCPLWLQKPSWAYCESGANSAPVIPAHAALVNPAAVAPPAPIMMEIVAVFVDINKRWPFVLREMWRILEWNFSGVRKPRIWVYGPLDKSNAFASLPFAPQSFCLGIFNVVNCYELLQKWFYPFTVALFASHK